MRTPRCAALVLLYLLALGTACAPLSGRPAADIAPDTAAARAALLEAHRALFVAFERGDAAALADLATEDTRLYAPGQPDVNGRAALDELGRRMFAQVRFSDLRTESMELEICGETAYELTAYTQVMHLPGGAAPVPVRGRALRVWRRGPDGRWRVHRNLYNWERPAAAG